jgi:hypothetical protein
LNDPYDNDDDDGYDDDYYDYPNPSHNPYQWYFKFDASQDTPLSSWINDMINGIINPKDNLSGYNINNIPGFPVKKFPVNSWNPNTGKGKSFQYLGSNYVGEPIWKSKYWIVDPLDQEYVLHLQNHAAHFVKQPSYYKGMFDILN